jgi:hypothetical protein
MLKGKLVDYVNCCVPLKAQSKKLRSNAKLADQVTKQPFHETHYGIDKNPRKGFELCQIEIDQLQILPTDLDLFEAFL